MFNYPKEFDKIVEKAMERGPKKAAVVGSNSANILKGVFAAQEAGFVEPILIGNFRKTKEMLDELGLADRHYDFYPTGNNANPVQYAIEMIQAGGADVLVQDLFIFFASLRYYWLTAFCKFVVYNVLFDTLTHCSKITS